MLATFVVGTLADFVLLFDDLGYLFLLTQLFLLHSAALPLFVCRSRVRVLKCYDHEAVSYYHSDLQQFSRYHDPSLASAPSSSVSARQLLRDPSPFEPSRLRHLLPPTCPRHETSRALWRMPLPTLEYLPVPFHLLEVHSEYATACFLDADE